ncbi:MULTISPECIES: bifunctional riboflavin kinase/FAD synthetase [Idiomarina]|uniref:bifunctional riboflavin kinase/FAD synthetase n=1 Tax=Idiomarina TaxID=135575 RepID=UPI00129A3106|nr:MULTISPECIES: bifunctional riboflavin kinase/FAD synthetase [Idiomarina]MRJ41260.1 bifunctional riboflavin kinase/FAD synthetase [Idiomarina sp. FeN1]NCU56425.1 bifunctional riboflavin kinase/FAD synthetase [Idiomarina sp. FenA--70]NCU59444.1 bifunctional riboflavin kinase/FAD synthetase [Idiomarina sp. FenBw--71]UUN12615.1 bifunctional riboflavin kinase/FAD synthetase [Idiomarina loihiensis]
MQLIRGIHNIRSIHRGCVLTIGNFDGVHLGHQAVLAQVKQQAQERGVAATVMTFEPQPQELFQPDKAPARLTNLREKHQALRAQGIDRHIVIEFNRKFANMPAADFIEQVLVAKLGVKFLVVGDDFRFGHGRTGDFAMLQRAGAEFGFAVVDTQSYRQQQQRVSSTAIRQALTVGDFAAAEAMLGRPFAFAGRVVHGEKKGRTIGFPTANLQLKRLHSPLRGVFAVQVQTNDGKMHAGVANIGRRPTLNGERVQLEVHLFDFTGDLYGQQLQVVPRHFIRAEQKFADFAALQQQIERDARAARELRP